MKTSVITSLQSTQEHYSANATQGLFVKRAMKCKIMVLFMAENWWFKLFSFCDNILNVGVGGLLTRIDTKSRGISVYWNSSPSAP
ncbi:hypothetical protein Pmani_008132 [Petrolisthes manimaculis]|uniref:Uncharacterized protein n=1 Tax=Petrolisthes manimaculis TaxID=1843537 RepID=A0AAE1Q630_9EUCA|nr:hypothetical protein Pmani_008132 [Petrolisthes manimaculis]